MEKCPVMHGASTNNSRSTKNNDWWPNQINLGILRQHSEKSSPFDSDFNYSEEFKKLDYFQLKKDLANLMTDSQDWWPADYGHYGPFFVRLTWHAAGTYRTGDGRGGGGTGAMRFAPLNSWPDNGNLDKARRLLWPIKEKYGNKISWADLFILVGNVAIESMGGKTFGFGGGREDIWHPEEDIYWGAEKEWLGDARYKESRQSLENPLAAVQMGLIYVNPEGPNGVPDPLLSAQDIRETFARMAMNDEETVALIAGGHTFGKAHGAGDCSLVGPEPEGSPIESQGLGWKSSFKSGKGADAITSGIEGPWTSNPIQWDNGYFEMLLEHDWELSKSPSGAHQWRPIGLDEKSKAIDVDNGKNLVEPMMTTADIALIKDPLYKKISENFYKNPQLLQDSFAKAWFKLLHRDMGPKQRYLGPEVPEEDLIWQDPVPKNDVKFDVALAKDLIKKSSLTIIQMIETAWSSASTFRCTDLRGGANGSRIRLSPQKDWTINKPKQLSNILEVIKSISQQVNASIADIIILAGNVGIELASQSEVPFKQGRGDALSEMTDKNSFDVLEPQADAFRNYLAKNFTISPEEMMLDKAHMLNLTASEMTVLLAGLRSIGISSDERGLWTEGEKLSNKWLKILLDTDIEWTQVGSNSFDGLSRKSGEVLRTASRCDLIFGSNSELRAIAEFYAQDDNNGKFVCDFISAWNKVMNSDLY